MKTSNLPASRRYRFTSATGGSKDVSLKVDLQTVHADVQGVGHVDLKLARQNVDRTRTYFEGSVRRSDGQQVTVSFSIPNRGTEWAVSSAANLQVAEGQTIWAGHQAQDGEGKR